MARKFRSPETAIAESDPASIWVNLTHYPRFGTNQARGRSARYAPSDTPKTDPSVAKCHTTLKNLPLNMLCRFDGTLIKLLE